MENNPKAAHSISSVKVVQEKLQESAFNTKTLPAFAFNSGFFTDRASSNQINDQLTTARKSNAPAKLQSSPIYRKINHFNNVTGVQSRERAIDYLKRTFTEAEYTFDDLKDYRVLIMWRVYRMFFESLGAIAVGKAIFEEVDCNTEVELAVATDFAHQKRPQSPVHKAVLNNLTNLTCQLQVKYTNDDGSVPELNFKVDPKSDFDYEIHRKVCAVVSATIQAEKQWINPPKDRPGQEVLSIPAGKYGTKGLFYLPCDDLSEANQIYLYSQLLPELSSVHQFESEFISEALDKVRELGQADYMKYVQDEQGFSYSESWSIVRLAQRGLANLYSRDPEENRAIALSMLEKVYSKAIEVGDLRTSGNMAKSIAVVLGATDSTKNENSVEKLLGKGAEEVFQLDDNQPLPPKVPEGN